MVQDEAQGLGFDFAMELLDVQQAVFFMSQALRGRN
jgi:hypothetical protein